MTNANTPAKTSAASAPVDTAASAVATAYAAVAAGCPSYADELLSVSMSASKFADAAARGAVAAATNLQAWVDSKPEGSSRAQNRVAARWATASKAAAAAWRAELAAGEVAAAWPVVEKMMLSVATTLKKSEEAKRLEKRCWKL